MAFFVKQEPLPPTSLLFPVLSPALHLLSAHSIGKLPIEFESFLASAAA